MKIIVRIFENKNKEKKIQVVKIFELLSSTD